MTRFLRPLIAIVGVFALFTLMYVEATDARPRGGVGSRGARTFTPPPKTNTAPGTAQPIQRSTTPAQPSTATRTAAPAATGAAARPGLFNRPGFMGGLVAGLLGAGLIGLLFGQGLLGNLAGFASILGLLLQLALIGGVAFLLLRWWQSRSQPQPALAGAGAGGPQNAPHAYGAPAAADIPAPAPLQNSNPRPGYGGDAPGGSANGQDAEPYDEIGLKPEDYDAFERLLGEIQTSYSKEDVAALRERATPEMMGYLNEELGENLSRGVAAALSRVKLLQGDLAEAWAEDNAEYATVALRYELIDTVIDRKTREMLEGDPNSPVEATELWTFMRSRKGGKWLLSAIQQMEDEGEEPNA
jgi:predicted lipid-binding transport protein (Tim44 family)